MPKEQEVAHGATINLDALQPFSCLFNNDNDGPRIDYLQNPAGQKLIYSIDAPGPFKGINPENTCQLGANLIYSNRIVLNFQVKFTNKITKLERILYYHVNISVKPPAQLDRANSKIGYGNESLDF